MTIDILIAGLIGVSFIAVLIVAITSKMRTDRRLEDDDAPRSSLASDGDSNRRADI